MNISKNGLYDNYPIFFVQQLKKTGRRDMAMGFMDYWDDYRAGNVQCNSYYAKCWHSSYKSRGKTTIGISHTTAKEWITEFITVIENFEASWELFENAKKATVNNNVEKSIDNQKEDKADKKTSKRPEITEERTNQPELKSSSIDANNITNNNPLKLAFNDEDLLLSKELLSHITDILPKFKLPDLKAWAKDCYKMRIQDNRTIEEIGNMLKFIFTNENIYGYWNGNFFKSQVLNMKSLRNKYDMMSVQIRGALAGL